MPGHARTQRGFTLLEAIVTLVIVSLLVTILMQALSQAVNLRTRLISFESESRRAVLQEAWFREDAAGMQRGYDVQDGELLGDATSLEFETPAPLVARGFSQVRWWIEHGQLHYADSAVADIVIVDGPLQNARFRYLDQAGRWVDHWAWRDHKVMPRLIRFSAAAPQGDLDWLVLIQANGPDPTKLKLDVDGSNGI